MWIFTRLGDLKEASSSCFHDLLALVAGRLGRLSVATCKALVAASALLFTNLDLPVAEQMQVEPDLAGEGSNHHVPNETALF